MSSEKSWLTPKEAGLLVGYSARHIQNLIVSGKLRATKEDGKYYIEKSDFNFKFPNVSISKEKYNELEKELHLTKSLLETMEKTNNTLKKTLKEYHDSQIKMLGLINSLTGLLAAEQLIKKSMDKKGMP